MIAFSCVQWLQHSTPWFQNWWKEESAILFNIKNRTIHSNSWSRKEWKRRYIKTTLYIEFNISGANRTQLYKSNRIPTTFPFENKIEKATIKRSTIIINLKSLQHLIFISMFDVRCLFILFRFDLIWFDLRKVRFAFIENECHWNSIRLGTSPFFSSYLSLLQFVYNCLHLCLWFYSERNKWKLMAHHSIESN